MAIVGISTAIIDIRAMDHATGSLRGIASNISQVGRAISGAGLAMTASFTIPMVAAGIASVKLATEFDKAMKNIQAIGKQTDSEIAALGKTFIATSQDITKGVASAEKLAKAYYEIQSAGFSGPDAKKMLEVANLGATAGLADPMDTTKALAGVVNAYGLEADSYMGVMDKIVRAVDIGVFHLPELTQQIGDFTNSASLLNIPFEQMLAFLSTATKRTVPLSEAATSLNQILTAYLKPSDKAAAGAKAFGIELSAATIKTKGFYGAMEELYAKTGGDPGALGQIFTNVRSFRGISALMKDAGAMYRSDLDAIANSQGTTAQVAGVALKSWDSILQNFKNTVQATGITIGTILLPMLTQVASALGRLAEAFSKLSPETQTSIVKFAIAFAAFGPALIIVGQLINSIGILVGVFTGMAAVPTIMAAIGFAALAVGAAMSFWNDNTLGIADKMQKLADSGTPIAGIFKAIVIELNNLKTAGFFDAHSPLLDQLLGGDKVAIDIDPVKLLAEAIHGVAKETIMARLYSEQFANAISYIGEIGQVVFKGLSIVISNLGESLAMLLNVMGKAASAIGKLIQKPGDTSGFDDVRSSWTDFMTFQKNASDELAMINPGEKYGEFFAKQTAALAQANKELRAINAPEIAAPINPLAKIKSDIEDKAGKFVQNKKLDIISDISGIDRATMKQYKSTEPDEYLKQLPGDILGAIAPKNLPSVKLVDDFNKYMSGPMEDGALVLAQVMNAHAAEISKASDATTKSYEVTNGRVNPALEDLAQVGVALKSTMTPLATELGKIASPEEIAAALKAAQDGATDAGTSLDKLTQASNPLADAFNSIFQAAIEASKRLSDLSGTPGAGGVTPGANGPFEDIYRLQAWINDKTHGDVAAKAGVTTDEQGKSIVGAFQNNNWAPAIAAGLIDKTKLGVMADAQVLSTQAGTGESPYGATNMAALAGMGLTPQQAAAINPAKAGGATVKQVTTVPGQTQVAGGGGVSLGADMGKLAKDMSQDAEKNSSAFNEAGGKVFGYWQDGFFAAADTSNLMVSLVNRLVLNAMSGLVPAGAQ